MLMLVHGLHRLSLRIRRDDGGYRNRMRRTPMTGVASDLTFALEMVLVDGKHHLHHLAGGLLFFLVVLIKLMFNVAKVALTPSEAAMNCMACINWSAGMVFNTWTFLYCWAAVLTADPEPACGDCAACTLMMVLNPARLRMTIALQSAATRTQEALV